MPMVVPFLPLIAGAVTSGISLVKGFMGNDGPDPKAGLAEQQAALEQQQMKDKQAAEQQQAAAMRRVAPDAQAQTGGALTDSGFAQLVASLSGNTGAGDLAKTTLFGGDSGGLYDSFMSMSSPITTDNGMPQMTQMS